MRIVVAPDGFKGSLEAAGVAEALSAGLRRALPEAEVVALPLADGGEGTVVTLVNATAGTLRTHTVTGPLGAPVEARWGLLGDGATAVVEMAAAAGLTLVPEDARNPERTTTRGVGELLLAARDAGCASVVVGLGGSATCDGGAGLAQALGYRLLDAAGVELPPGGGALVRLARIEATDAASLPPIRVACDVDNPLCGPRGAAPVYGPQKGASAAATRRLDAGLARLAEVVARDLGRDVAAVPGVGAAGGLGAGLLAFTDARLERGAELVLDALAFESQVEGAELVVTGEGCLDEQTLAGKAPRVVARRARALGVPVVAAAGRVSLPADALRLLGIDRAVQVTPDGMSFAEACDRVRELLESAGYALGKAHRS